MGENVLVASLGELLGDGEGLRARRLPSAEGTLSGCLLPVPK